jgi:hypothetical protein
MVEINSLVEENSSISLVVTVIYNDLTLYLSLLSSMKVSNCLSSTFVRIWLKPFLKSLLPV